MKIGIFTETYEPYVSGVTTSIKMLKESLEAMGHLVYIVTVNLKKYKFEYDKENRIIYLCINQLSYFNCMPKIT